MADGPCCGRLKKFFWKERDSFGPLAFQVSDQPVSQVKGRYHGFGNLGGQPNKQIQNPSRIYIESSWKSFLAVGY